MIPLQWRLMMRCRESRLFFIFSLGLGVFAGMHLVRREWVPFWSLSALCALSYFGALYLMRRSLRTGPR